MAAGAVPPEQALPFAFEHGADYVCMGMMDFQIVDDVNNATAVFDRGFPKRKRMALIQGLRARLTRTPGQRQSLFLRRKDRQKGGPFRINCSLS